MTPQLAALKARILELEEWRNSISDPVMRRNIAGRIYSLQSQALDIYKGKDRG